MAPKTIQYVSITLKVGWVKRNNSIHGLLHDRGRLSWQVEGISRVLYSPPKLTYGFHFSSLTLTERQYQFLFETVSLRVPETSTFPLPRWLLGVWDCQRHVFFGRICRRLREPETFLNEGGRPTQRLYNSQYTQSRLDAIE